MSTTSTSTTKSIAQLWATRQGFGIRLYSQADYEWLQYFVRYTHRVTNTYTMHTPTATSYAVFYINTVNVPTELIPTIRDRFQIVNDQPKVARHKIDRSQQLASRIANTKSMIARYDLNREIKPAMLRIFGSPAAVKAAFAEHNFYIKGHATLTQCLRLLELTKHLKECLEILQQSPAPSVNATPIPSSSKAPQPTVEDIPPHYPLTCAYEPKSCPLATPLATPLACPVEFTHQVTVEVFPPLDEQCITVEAARVEPQTLEESFDNIHAAAVEVDIDAVDVFLNGLTLTQLRKYMKHNGIPGKGTRGYKKSQLIDHIIDFYYA